MLVYKKRSDDVTQIEEFNEILVTEIKLSEADGHDHYYDDGNYDEDDHFIDNEYTTEQGF